MKFHQKRRALGKALFVVMEFVLFCFEYFFCAGTYKKINTLMLSRQAYNLSPISQRRFWPLRERYREL